MSDDMSDMASNTSFLSQPRFRQLFQATLATNLSEILTNLLNLQNNKTSSLIRQYYRLRSVDLSN